MIELPEVAVPERKVPVITRPDYTVSLERTSGMTFVHCDVSRWTPSVKRDLARDWTVFVFLNTQPLWAIQDDPDDRKHAKFLAMFGFRRVARFTDRESGRDRLLLQFNRDRTAHGWHSRRHHEN